LVTGGIDDALAGEKKTAASAAAILRNDQPNLIKFKKEQSARPTATDMKRYAAFREHSEPDWSKAQFSS
jgi:hypothetical protein